MIFILCACALVTSGVVAGKRDKRPENTCLTGSMTDVQTWVNEDGTLTTDAAAQGIDLSSNKRAINTLNNQLKVMTEPIRYLSLARCGFDKVPIIFHFENLNQSTLSKTLEYLSFYGNPFVNNVSNELYESSVNASEAVEINALNYDIEDRQVKDTWYRGFKDKVFDKLQEIDLRGCGIDSLEANIFIGMKALQALYLSENNILFVDENAFFGLSNLIHLDISDNFLLIDPKKHLQFQKGSFKCLDNLKSLDLSHTIVSTFSHDNIDAIGRKIERLSLCHSMTGFGESSHNFTSLKYLDVSNNLAFMGEFNAIVSAKNSLKILYAAHTDIVSLNMLMGFENLEILKVPFNAIDQITTEAASTWKNLQILDLEKNKIRSWSNGLFTSMTSLKYLSLKNNNLNIITSDMARDVSFIKYLGLSDNFLICNCYIEKIVKIGLRNHNRMLYTALHSFSKEQKDMFDYNNAYAKYNNIVFSAQLNNTEICNNTDICNELIETNTKETNTNGDYILLDFNLTSYTCMFIDNTTSVRMTLPNSVACLNTLRELDYDQGIQISNKKILILLMMPITIIPVMMFLYIYRRNLKYFCITVRNSALLSLINNRRDGVNDNLSFNYDVFVSYCNPDRNWVLDKLLANVEKDSNISVCLHERDFQVGLSILENIVSCMDRSRAIILVISKQFLLSQWCQFEMHLAQHRLLETRREDMILILLEDIPRRLRPNTLHYLMITKTYLVWPKDPSDEPIFWKRLMKSLEWYGFVQADSNNSISV